MNSEDKKRYYLDSFGFFIIGIISLGYVVYVRELAERHIQLPFLNFPIFIGEIFLFICLLLFWAKYKNHRQEFTKWHYLITCYFIFVLIKALYGYWHWGPLALRHAALLYYPVFAVFGYAFFRKDFFAKKICLILSFVIFAVLFGRHSKSWLLSLVLLGAILIKSYPNQRMRLIMFFLLLIVTPYKEFFQTSRMMIVGNFLAGLYLAGVTPSVLQIKKKMKFVLMVLITGIIVIGLVRFGDRGAVKSIVAFKKMVEVVKSCDAYIKANVGNFKMKERKEVKLYNPDKIIRNNPPSGATSGGQKILAKRQTKVEVKQSVEPIKIEVPQVQDQSHRNGVQEVNKEKEQVMEVPLVQKNAAPSVEPVKTKVFQSPAEPVRVGVSSVEVQRLVEKMPSLSVEPVKKEVSQVQVDHATSDVQGQKKETQPFLAPHASEEKPKPLAELSKYAREEAPKPLAGPIKTEVSQVEKETKKKDVKKQRPYIELPPVVVVAKTRKSSQEPIKAEVPQVKEQAQKKNIVEAKGETQAALVVPLPQEKPKFPTESIKTNGFQIKDKSEDNEVEEVEIRIRRILAKHVPIRTSAISSDRDVINYDHLIVDGGKKEMPTAVTKESDRKKSIVPSEKSETGWIDNNNAVFRLLIWRDMLADLVREKPVLGFDLGRPFRSKSLEILNWGTGDWDRDGWIEPHNSYLHIIYRTGLVGILLILSLLIILIKMIRQFILIKSLTGVFLCASIINCLTTANFLVIFELPYTAIPIWAIFGMTLAYCYKKQEKNCNRDGVWRP